MTEIVARDVAESEFDRFCELMDIDRDTNKMAEDDAKGFNENKEILIKAITDGRLVISEDGEPEYTPKRGDFPNPLIFKEPNGGTYAAMDRQKSGNDVGKMLALMDAMSRSTPGTCAKLANVDFKVVRAIAILFLA